MPTSENLPIAAIKAKFCHTIAQHSLVVLSAPPGAGKSTCLPLWLLSLTDFAQQKIYLLQPRRLAVKNIANYLAEQLNEPVGHTIGYRLKNESKISKNTRLEVITEGILTQIIQQDAELTHCGLVIFDEFHERSIQGDLSFALARDVQQGLREDLKILLMSATLDINDLVHALPDAKVLCSEGRSYPVDIQYSAAKNVQHWRQHALSIVKQQILHHQGSILVFLPGVGDIRYMQQGVSECCPDDLEICPLFGSLTLKQQQQAIQPCINGKRKVVLTTNIAETSLTIEGVNMVIDSGFEKVAIYDHENLLNRLTQLQIAKSSAVQRAGRAGRLMAGHCIRLYAKEDYERRPKQGVHDIQQADLLPLLMEAARWGVNQLADLPLLEYPAKIKEDKAWRELQALELVNEHHKLTHHGNAVAQFPCHPRFAHMLIKAKGLGEDIALLACIVTALLEERDIFSSDRSRFESNINTRIDWLIDQWHNPKGALINIIKQVKVLWRKLDINKALRKPDWLAHSLSMTGVLLAYAYPERIAKKRNNSGDFMCANGKGVIVDEQDALAQHDFLVIADLIKVNHLYKVGLAAEISLAQIEKDLSHYIVEQEVASFDENSGKISVKQQRKFSALVLTETHLANSLTDDVVASMWCDYVQQKGLNLALNWQAKDRSLLARWRWLTRYFPEYHFPEVSDEALLEKLPLWFSPFVAEIKSTPKLAKLDLSSMLLTLLDYQQQQILKQAAPSHYIGPTGRHCPITYSDEKSPKVSLPMQEVYGLQQSPTIGIADNMQINNSIPLVLELLSPAQRPIQVTKALAEFWAGSYKMVQKEMKSRYPKHYWPDDPANAQATNKTKRHIKH